MKFEKKGVPFWVARRRGRPAGDLVIPTASRMHEKRVVDRCRVPTPEGPCGHPLFEDEPRSKMDAHVVECCRRHHDTIMEERERQHPEIMRPWDPELASWVKEHGPAILEGRKRI